ncbi:hypothetical protein EEB19_21625 [Gordonia sp. OPL2]|nr:hypothetical protein EEB19_21625 [Gordonia sp. OPL2]
MDQLAVDPQADPAAGRHDAEGEFMSTNNDDAVAVRGPVDLDSSRPMGGGGGVERGLRRSGPVWAGPGGCRGRGVVAGLRWSASTGPS